MGTKRGHPKSRAGLTFGRLEASMKTLRIVHSETEKENASLKVRAVVCVGADPTGLQRKLEQLEILQTAHETSRVEREGELFEAHKVSQEVGPADLRG